MSPAVRRALEDRIAEEREVQATQKGEIARLERRLAWSREILATSERSEKEIRAALDGGPADVPVPLDLEQDGDR